MHLVGLLPRPQVPCFCLMRAKLEVKNLCWHHMAHAYYISHSIIDVEGSSADLMKSVICACQIYFMKVWFLLVVVCTAIWPELANEPESSLCQGLVLDYFLLWQDAEENLFCAVRF